MKGCAKEAQHAVRWLLDIGVAPERIHLHVAAAAATPADMHGVTVRNADHDGVLTSMNTLAASSGDRLFVFMMGHGLYVNGEGPIFLTEDYADPSTQRNLKLHDYLTWFQSWPYRDQFVFYDACQTPTAVIGQVSPVRACGPDLPPDAYWPHPDNGLTVCCAASDDETL